jgi:hypothetical protein
MSQTHINYNDKYHRVIKFSQGGVITSAQSITLSRDKEQFLSTENTLRISCADVNANNVIELQVKLLSETTWTTLGSITGPTSKTFDISTWDQIRYNVSNFDAPGTGIMHVSGFVSQLNADASSADFVKITDTNGNDLVLELQDGKYVIPVTFNTPSTTPKISNLAIAVENTIYSVLFENNASKIMVQQRETGTVQISFDPAFSTYITLPNGTTYTESDLNLQGVTLYFRSTKTGTLEVLEWYT